MEQIPFTKDRFCLAPFKLLHAGMTKMVESQSPIQHMVIVYPNKRDENRPLQSRESVAHISPRVARFSRREANVSRILLLGMLKNLRAVKFNCALYVDTVFETKITTLVFKENNRLRIQNFKNEGEFNETVSNRCLTCANTINRYPN